MSPSTHCHVLSVERSNSWPPSERACRAAPQVRNHLGSLTVHQGNAEDEDDYCWPRHTRGRIDDTSGVAYPLDSRGRQGFGHRVSAVVVDRRRCGEIELRTDRRAELVEYVNSVEREDTGGAVVDVDTSMGSGGQNAALSAEALRRGVTRRWWAVRCSNRERRSTPPRQRRSTCARTEPTCTELVGNAGGCAQVSAKPAYPVAATSLHRVM
jgi:hypothetical protein